MSNELRTRHLVVTLPDTSGEEADATAAWIERANRRDVPGTKVEHGLGESVIAGGLPEVSVHAEPVDGLGPATVGISTDGTDVIHYLTADEARQLAGALFILAGETDHANNTHPCVHCGRDVTNVDGQWVDTAATGDDGVWRETCGSHDTFTAEHQVSV